MRTGTVTPRCTFLLVALLGVACAEGASEADGGATPAAGGRTADVIIRNARVVDGTGAAAYEGDVAIEGDRIAAVGNLAGWEADRELDAAGRVVAPGFIDMMGQSSLPLALEPRSAQSKLRQGITTMLSGEGGSPAPLDDDMAAGLAEATGEEIPWRSFTEYVSFLERRGIGINVVHNVGATQIRRVVLGSEDVTPDSTQMAEMERRVAEAIDAGAIGVSTALIYPPAIYASTDELIRLNRVAAPGGVYFTHMRNEGVQLLDAIDEAIQIGREAGVAVHIFHLKAAGEANWPLMARALDRIRAARESGLEVTADIYPYIRNGIGLGSFLHPRHYARGTEAFLRGLADDDLRRRLREELETTYDWENWYKHVGEDWSNVLISGVGDGDDKLLGQSIAEAADQRGVDPWDLFFDLAMKGGVSVSPRSMNEAQKVAAMQTDFVAFDTDAPPMDPATSEGAHPRAFGAFARVISKYVRQDSSLTLEQAVERLAALPARILGLDDRGTVTEGKVADLVVFDPARVEDRATFTEPLQYSEGFDFVFVNGQPAIDGGEFRVDAQAGRVLRR